MKKGEARKVCSLCIGMIALVLVSTANAQLTNPGFESNPPLSGWTPFNAAFGLGTGPGTSGALASGSPHGGNNVLQAYGPFISNWDAAGVYQDIATTAGTPWTLTGYGMNPSGDAMALLGSGFGIIQIVWFDASNVQIGGSIDSTAINKTAGLQDTWQLLTAAGVAPAGTVKVRILALHVNGPDNSGGSAYFDDLSAVPEPSSIVLVLTGLLGVVAVGWKKRRV